MKKLLIISAMVVITGCNSKPTLPDPLAAGWNGNPVCELLEDNDHVRVLQCTFPPGVGHEKHYHDTHFGYTVKGSTFRITDTTGVREVAIPSGTHFYNERVEWHEVQNIGDSTAVFLIMEPK
ncbi:MAG: cupin domain-containing protein [Bacteroidota bacterium]